MREWLEKLQEMKAVKAIKKYTRKFAEAVQKFLSDAVDAVEEWFNKYPFEILSSILLVAGAIIGATVASTASTCVNLNHQEEWWNTGYSAAVEDYIRKDADAVGHPERVYEWNAKVGVEDPTKVWKTTIGGTETGTSFSAYEVPYVA